MGATFYTLQWAEVQWARLERGEKLSAHEQHAMLLVYRQAWLRMNACVADLRYELSDLIEDTDLATSGTPEIVLRDGTWRLRVDGNEEPL